MLSGFVKLVDFERRHRHWIEEALEGEPAVREDRWSEVIAVGSLAFVENVKNHLGVKAVHRDVIEADGSYALRETAEAYGFEFASENEALRSQNTIFGNETADEARK